MFSSRVIPSLTLIDDGLYRTKKFKKPSYVGDPLNAVRIFNEKEVDELFVLDITPSHTWDEGRLQLLTEMAEEAFMPMGLGGNISSVTHVERAFEMGYDKVVINSAAIGNTPLIKELAGRFGGQSIVVSIDVGKKMFGGASVYADLGRKTADIDPVEHAQKCEQAGAGEIVIRSIAHDGLMDGFDLDLIARVSSAVSVPVVAAGGAGSLEDLSLAMEAGAHAVTAGSMFVYHGPHRAVLINYPDTEELNRIFSRSKATVKAAP